MAGTTDKEMPPGQLMSVTLQAMNLSFVNNAEKAAKLLEGKLDAVLGAILNFVYVFEKRRPLQRVLTGLSALLRLNPLPKDVETSLGLIGMLLSEFAIRAHAARLKASNDATTPIMTNLMAEQGILNTDVSDK